MNYKVVILCAGKGSRLSERTRYFNKSLIKVGNKAVISHTIDSFPEKTEFVIALGYKSDIVRQYLEISYPSRNFTFVDIDKYSVPGSGPGYALLKCKDYLQSPFYYVSCDAIINWKDLLHIDYSWVGYDTIAESDKDAYCTIYNPCGCCVVDYFNKSKDGTTDAFVGVSYIKEYEKFWKNFENIEVSVEDEIQVSPTMLSLENISPVRVRWFDTGNEESLQKARNHFKGIQNLDKLDEEIYFFDNYAIKYFYNEKNVCGRMERGKRLVGLIPDIVSHTKNFYKYKFVEGEDLFSVDNIDEIMFSLLQFSKNNLWKDFNLENHENRLFKDCCKKFYYDKTISRLQKLFSEKNISDSGKTINGEEIPSTKRLLELIDWENISDGISSGFHGDFCLGNILLDNAGQFKFIDYRQDFCGIVEYGDRYYDFAKMYCSFLMPQSSVKKNEFWILENDNDIKVSINVPEKLKKAQKSFEEFIVKENYSLDKVKILSGLVLLNMSPLHESPLDKWLYFYGKHFMTKSLFGKNRV